MPCVNVRITSDGVTVILHPHLLHTMTSTPPPEPYVEYHKDGSVWAVGQKIGDTPVGYWEWSRVDGTKLRSGTFEDGEQVGEWTTYDRQGEVYKVTRKKPKAPTRTSQ